MRDLIAHYDDVYSGVNRWREVGAIDKVSNLVALWGDRGAPSILDVGCGEGAFAAEVVRRGFAARYVGLEVSSSAVVAARSRQLHGVRFEQFDGCTIPAPDDEFDLVVLSHVVEHLENPRVILNEAKRVGRHVFVEVPLEHHLRTPRDHAWTDVGHVNIYDPLTIRHLVQSVGLRLISQRVSNSSRQVISFHIGPWRGTPKWVIREALLRLVPPVATRLFTYNGSLLAA